jgi:hypothetical protein
MKDHINLLELYAKGSTNGWNEFLNDCLNKQDTNRLAKVMRAIQIGMDEVVKLRLNEEKVCIFYIRLLKSIENTLRAILRKKYPNPRDNPLFNKNKDLLEKKWHEIKIKRDQEFEAFLRKSSF